MKTTIATYLTATCRSFQIIRKFSFLSKTRNIKVKLTRIRNTNYSVSCWESFYLITGTLFRGTIMIQISTNLLRIVAMCRVRALFLIMLRNFSRNISQFQKLKSKMLLRLRMKAYKLILIMVKNNWSTAQHKLVTTSRKKMPRSTLINYNLKTSKKQ